MPATLVSGGGREAGLRRGAGYPEQEGQQADQNKGTPNSAAHRVTSSVDGWKLGSQGWAGDPRAELTNVPRSRQRVYPSRRTGPITGDEVPRVNVPPVALDAAHAEIHYDR